MSAILAETAVLGCCLTDPKAYWQIAATLRPEDFTSSLNARLFDEIVARGKAGHVFDAVTIGEERPDLRDVAMDAMLAEGWRVSNIAGYATRVAESSLLRRLKQAGARIAHLDGEDPYGQAQRILSAVAPRHQGTVRHVREYIAEAVADLQARYEASEELTGLPTGIPELDAAMGGLQAPDLIVIAARPSVGKTAFLLQLAYAAIEHRKRAALCFSLEMSGKQLTDRLTSAAGIIDGSLLRRPKGMDESDWHRWAGACERISKMPLYIDETPGIGLEALGARARQMQAELAGTETPLGLIAVDYLQLMKLDMAKGRTKSDAIGDITGGLKNLAKELGVPVIALSQLNRGAEDSEPTMASLRDSGAIESDADVIIFLHRPDKKHWTFIEGILAKQRNGVTLKLALQADYKYMRFSVTDQVPAGIKSDARTSAANDAWTAALREGGF